MEESLTPNYYYYYYYYEAIFISHNICVATLSVHLGS